VCVSECVCVFVHGLESVSVIVVFREYVCAG